MKIINSGLGKGEVVKTVLGDVDKFFTSFAGSATLGVTTALAMTKAIQALSDAYNLSYDSAIKNTEANVNNFKSTKTEIEGLESNIQQYKDTLSSLGEKYEVDLSGIESVDDIITKLRQSGKLELTDEIELQKIDSQNASLERQLAIKNKLIESQQKLAAADAKDTLGRGEQSVAQQVAQFVPGGKKTYQGMVNNVNIVDAVNENVAAIQKYENAIADAENAMRDLNPDSKAWKKQEENINSYNEAIEKLTSDLNTKEADLSTLLSALSVDGEGLVALEGYENEFNAVKDAINNLNNMSLTPLQQEYAKIESFFDGSDNKNSIKQRLQEAVNEGENLSDVLAGMGVTLSDLDIENIDTLASYFTKTAEAADDAKKTVQDYATTVADVVASGETANQDDNWTNFSEAYKTANELLKEGKTGVDDFQSVAALLNPAKVKELAEKGGKYTADAYEEAFREVKKIADRWFSEDETKSMENFVNDFKKAGLFDVTTDDKGLWDIETKFKSTAEAAKEFGISVEAVETMLQGLQAYGYEFDEILFSGDGLERYQENLAKIKTLYESMGEGSSKDALGEMISNWDSELEKYKEDLDSLSEPQIVQIEFQYDIAQIEAELEKLRDRQNAGDEFTRTDYAEWINTYDSKYAQQQEGFGLDKVEVKAVSIADDAVEKAREELAKAVAEDDGSGKGIMEAQVKLVAAQESRDAILESFNKWNLEQEVPVTIDSDDAEFQAAWKKFVEEPHVIKIEGEIDTKTIGSTLEGLTAGSTVVYKAKMDGDSEAEITALKHSDGSITYTANVDGIPVAVEPHQEKDGVVYYEADMDEVEKTDPPVLTGIAKYEAIFKDKKAPSLSGKAYYDAVIRGTTVRGTTGSEMYGYASASGTMLSPAHHTGTAYNVLNTLPFSAYAGGRVGLPRDERALVNEEYINGHSESIVRDGIWRLIPGGAHLENLKQGDLIFSAQQTEDLLRSGKTPGHARAFAQGNVLASAYRLGNNSNNGSGSGSSKSAEKALEALDKLFDWIEVRFERLARLSENAIDAIDRASSLSKKLSASTKAIKAVEKEITASQKAAKEYLAQAKSVAKQTGLSSSIQKKIQNGTIDIGSYSEKTQEKISQYKNYYDKYLESLDQVKEKQDEQRELMADRFDIIQNAYDNVTDRVDWQQDMIGEYMNQAEAKGQPVSSKYYSGMIKGEQNRIGYFKKERDALYKELESAVDSGIIKKNSTEWNEMVNSINEVTLEIEQANTAVLEFENSIRELDWSNFDLLQEKISNITEEADFLIELISDEKLIDDNGKLTDEGMATVGLHGQNYNTYMEQSRLLAEEIKDIEAEIANDPYNQDLIKRKEELLDLQREAILNAENEKDAIKSLVQDGINAEIDSMQKLADEYLEALRNAEDLYDYQKRIQSLTKKHAALQKQLLALENDFSEENKARLQSLRVQLEESQSDIEDTEREHAFKDTEKLVNTVVEEFTDTLNARLDNVDALIEQAIHDANVNATSINATLEEQADAVGYTLSEEIQSIWNGADGEKSVLAMYGDGITFELTTVNSTLNTINTNLQSMIEQLNKVAGTDVNGLAAQNAYNSDEATPDKKKTSSSTANKNTTTSNSSKKTSSGDGKITKGEKVTFDNGNYTAQSDGGGASGKQKLGEKVYVTNIKSGSERPYHISQDKAGKKPLGWVKKKQLKGYSSGAKYIDEDQLAWLNEYGDIESYIRQRDGAIVRVMGQGDRIMNSIATANLYDMANDPMKYFAENIGLEKLSAISSFTKGFGEYSYNGDINITVNAPNVTSIDEFKYALKHDPEIEATVRAMSVDRLFGKSRMRKFN